MFKKNKWIFYVIMPMIFFALFTLMYLLFGREILQIGMSGWKSAAVRGAIEYEYESEGDKTLKPTDGEIKQDEINYPSRGKQYGEIVSEKAELRGPLYYGDSEDILEKGIGTYTAFGLPGEGKTILTGGHDTTFYAPLEKLEVGDVLTVTTTYGDFRYEVYDSQIGNVTDESLYKLDDDSEVLILYTCYPFGETSGLREERYFVYAQKKSGPQIKEDRNEG